MKYRKLGKAGIKVSELSLGGWLTYGATVDDSHTEKIVKAAIEHGVNFIDIADIYAKGKSELAIGKAIKGMTRSNLVISSKVFWPMTDNVNDRGLSRKHIIESVEKSLKRIGTDYLDLYFCHRFDPDTEVEEVVRAMDHLINQGKVLYWGTSLWSAAQIEQAVGEAHRFLGYQPMVEQPRYNMLDRTIESEIMPVCSRNGLGLVVWSPLAQGILTGKYNESVPEKSRGGTSEWLKHELIPENIEKCKKLTEIANELNIKLSQLALAWVLRRPEVSSAITGATSPEQVAENIVASDVRLDVETLDRIEKILDNNPIKE